MGSRLVIGLTGNIASGKSAVGHRLVSHGTDLIDADQVAHEALAAGTEESDQIVARFGPGVLAVNGAIDRAALGKVVFGSPAALTDLEAIVHPGTRRRIYERIAASTAEVVVLEAIKLLEGPLVEHVDTVWVVTSSRATRIRRLVENRGFSQDEATRRVDAQNPETDKVLRADVVITNDGSVAELQQAVDVAWSRLAEGAGH